MLKAQKPSREELEQLAAMPFADAKRAAGVGGVKLQSWWAEEGIEPRVIKKQRKPKPSDLTDEQLAIWGKTKTFLEIKIITGLAVPFIRRLYWERGIPHTYRVDKTRVRLARAPEPVRGSPTGCDDCEWRMECERLAREGLPVRCEGLTDDDPWYYVNDVLKKMREAS